MTNLDPETEATIARAEAAGKWFRYRGGVWLTPTQFREHAASDYCDPANWFPTDPENMIEECEDAVSAARGALERAKGRLAKWRAEHG